MLFSCSTVFLMWVRIHWSPWLLLGCSFILLACNYTEINKVWTPGFHLEKSGVNGPRSSCFLTASFKWCWFICFIQPTVFLVFKKYNKKCNSVTSRLTQITMISLKSRTGPSCSDCLRTIIPLVSARLLWWTVMELPPASCGIILEDTRLYLMTASILERWFFWVLGKITGLPTSSNSKFGLCPSQTVLTHSTWWWYSAF